jgi:hypothetical protein
MKMQKKSIILLALTIAAHLYLGRCVVLSRWAMERHWCEALGSGFEPTSRYGQILTVTSVLPALPTATEISLRYGVLIPVLGLVATLGVAFLYRRPEHDQRFVTALLMVTLVSLSLTAYYCFGIARPPLTITYRIK